MDVLSELGAVASSPSVTKVSSRACSGSAIEPPSPASVPSLRTCAVNQSTPFCTEGDKLAAGVDHDTHVIATSAHALTHARTRAHPLAEAIIYSSFRCVRSTRDGSCTRAEAARARERRTGFEIKIYVAPPPVSPLDRTSAGRPC